MLFGTLTAGMLTTAYVRAAMNHNGYDVDFVKAEFRSMTKDGRKEMHDFYFINDDGDMELSTVYVWRNELNELIADW